jgi:cytochrome c biogenesis protein CcmG, thiol:disulfide interchange protein DsbE
MTENHKSVPRKFASSRTMALAIMGIGLFLLGGIALVLLTRTGSAKPEPEAEDYPPAIPVAANFQAPDLELTDINGNTSNLAAYTGKVVLVNNWAFWCPPCRAELPELEAYYEKHSAEDFTIIGIEAGSEKEDVVYHVNLYKLTYPIWLDPDTLAVKAFRNNGLPNSYVIDKTGVVRLAWNGPIDREMLDKYVTPLLKEQ